MKTAANPFFPLYDPFTDGTKFIPYSLQTSNVCSVLQIFEVIMNSFLVNNITRETVIRADKQGMAGARSAAGNASISGSKEAEKAKQGQEQTLTGPLDSGVRIVSHHS